MNFNQSNEQKLPVIHVFKDSPSFNEVKELPEGDLYAVIDGDDTIYWYEGDFTINLSPVTKNEEFFDNADSNHICITIDPSYNTSIDESPYDFNSETGCIKYHTSLVYDSIDLKNSTFDVEVITCDRYASESELEEIEKFKALGELIKSKKIRDLINADIEGEIDRIIDERQDDILKRERY